MIWHNPSDHLASSAPKHFLNVMRRNGNIPNFFLQCVEDLKCKNG